MSKKIHLTFEELISLSNSEDLPLWEKYSIQYEDLKYFSLLEQNPKIYLKKMFGALAIYRGKTLCILLSHDTETNSYKNKIFKFALWDGILIATSHEHHTNLIKIFKSAIPHPVLPKWLYIRRKQRGWLDSCKKVEKLIMAKSPLIGVKSKKSSASKK